MTGKEHLVQLTAEILQKIPALARVPENMKAAGLANVLAPSVITRAAALIDRNEHAAAIELIQCAREALGELKASVLSHPENVAAIEEMVKP
jgi:hypothetical protein